MKNEKELHHAIVKHIKEHLPKFRVIIAGMGELQTNGRAMTNARMKGFRSGCPDLVLLTPNQYYHGFACEFKNPNKPLVLRDNQKQFLNDLVLHSCFKCIASNDYELILDELHKYRDAILDDILN